MGRRLDKLIRPGERVVYRTRRTLAHLALPWIALAPFAAAWWAALSWYQGDWAVDPNKIVPVVALWLIVTVDRWGAAALVTDRRVLHRGGLIKPHVEEIPLGHIERLERVTFWITIRRRSGEQAHITSVADTRGLAAAIVAETGVPAPAARKPKVKRWSDFSEWFGLAAGFGGVFLAYVLIDRSVDWGGLDFAVSFALVFALLPAFPLALSIGYGLGIVAFTPLLRLVLTADEARQLFNPEERAEIPPWLVLFAIPAALLTGIARVLATILYRQRI